MNEARKQVFSCIDYCGDILGDRKEYSPQFSPNNIRTVIVSPDGIMLRLYKPVAGNLPKGVQHPSTLLLYTKVKTVALYTNKGKPDFDVTKEKSILSMLVDPLICGCIEEIVVLTEPSVPAFKPFVDKYSAWEFNFNFMVEKGEGSLLERLASRFPRLHMLSKVRMNFNDFLHSASAGVSALVKTEDVTSLLGNYVENTTQLNEGTWKEGHKLQPKVYALDNKLMGAFDKVSNDLNKAGGSVSEKRQRVFDCMQLYANIINEINTFGERITKTGRTPLFQDTELPRIEPVQFKEMPNTPDKLKEALSFIPTSEGEYPVLAYNYNMVFEQLKFVNDTLVDDVLRTVYFALVDMPTTAMQSLLINCEYFIKDGKMLIPAKSLTILRDIQGMCPDFTISSEGLNPVLDLGGSISETLRFLVDFAYMGGNNDNDSLSLSSVEKRLESGVFEGALRKCFEKMESRG